MKIVFIADAHLKGLKDPNQGRLVRFLESLEGADVLVMLGDGIYDQIRKVIFFKQLDSQLDMSPLFVSNNFADVMQETAKADLLDHFFR